MVFGAPGCPEWTDLMGSTPLWNRLASRLEHFFVRPRYPCDVLEICEDRCTAGSISARKDRLTIRSAATRDLPPAALDPHFSQKNFADERAVSAVCESVLKEAGIAPGPLTVLIPEACVKVTIHDDLDSIPSESQFVKELALQKLKKLLPFPTHEAVISTHIIRRHPKPLLLTVVMHSGILAQYEGLLTSLGYRPGCVDLPSFNVLRVAEYLGIARGSSPDLLLVNVDRSYLSQTLLVNGEMLLFRTKARGFLSADVPIQPQLRAVVEEVLTTVRYYEDKISGGQPVGRLLLRETNGHGHELREMIGSELSAGVELLDLANSLASGAETPAPLTVQLILPIVGAAIR